jgi:alkylation response protein AidB-like acyl-CoA dehydrogenase
VNRGWLVARATLGNERISIGGGSSAPTGFTVDDVIKLLDSAQADTAASYVRRAGEAIAEGHTLRLLNLRRVSRAIAGAEPGPEGNVTKLLLGELSQHLTELGMDLARGSRRHRTDSTAGNHLLRQPRDDDRGRHVGDHSQHDRRTDSRPPP